MHRVTGRCGLRGVIALQPGVEMCDIVSGLDTRNVEARLEALELMSLFLLTFTHFYDNDFRRLSDRTAPPPVHSDALRMM